MKSLKITDIKPATIEHSKIATKLLKPIKQSEISTQQSETIEKPTLLT